MSSNPRSRGIACATCRQDELRILRLLLGLDHRRLDPVEREEVRDLLDPVDDVVEPGRERVDVLAVDRRDERLVEALDDVVRDPVALLLADDDVARELAVSGHSRTSRSSRPAARTMFAPASSNRSKNSRSFGAKSLDSWTMAGESSCDPHVNL